MDLIFNRMNCKIKLSKIIAKRVDYMIASSLNNHYYTSVEIISDGMKFKIVSFQLRIMI